MPVNEFFLIGLGQRQLLLKDLVDMPHLFGQLIGLKTISKFFSASEVFPI